MERYTEICPICGTYNKDLNLEETNGFYECEKCGNVIGSCRYYLKLEKIPFFDMHKPEDRQRLLDFVGVKDKNRPVAQQ